MGKNEHGICVSKETLVKQQHLRGILRIISSGARKSILTWECVDPHFWMFDLNAARSAYNGLDGELIDGSTVVGMKVCESAQLRPKAYFCELLKDNADDLRNHFADYPGVTILEGDCSETLPTHLPFGNVPRFGYVYVDPNDAQLPIDLLISMFDRRSFQRIDLIVNVAAASLKRLINHPDYGDLSLATLLERVNKKNWIVREPHGKHEWTFIVGTNWGEFPDWEKQGFWRLQSEKGRKVWEVVSLTKKQRKAQVQPELFR